MNKNIQSQQTLFINKAEIDSVFDAQVKNRWNISQTTVSERIEKLKKLENWIVNNKQAIRDAIYNDFKKSAAEADLTEVFTALTEIRHTVRHLKKWTKPHRVKRTMALITTRSWIQYEPHGVVLIIAPWNYPFNLTVTPLISAIAAGNCIILKPSELAVRSSNLIARMVGELFPKDEAVVVEGKKEVAIELLKKPFDHIFFTGSTAVGKRVMEAASKNLSSITLELGGKSPVIVDETANIADAVKKIAWGKLINCGQTCVAPDYIIAHELILPQLIEGLNSVIQKFYGKTDREISDSPDYARIINQHHFRRIKQLLEDTVKAGAVLEFGGNLNEADNYIPPTVLSNISADFTIMEEEIFGPVLPIITYSEISAAINIIRAKPKPLALYIFSEDNITIDSVLTETSSGAVCINDTVIHFSQTNLPFGGVNASGMGRSHGFYGFKTFSNEKAVVKHNRFSPLKLMYPPYTKRVKIIIDFIVKYF